MTPTPRSASSLLALGLVLLATVALAADPAPPASAPRNRFGHARPLPRPEGTFRIATYNALNLFDHDDDPALEGEQDDLALATSEDRCRGLAAAIAAIDADVVALQEVESLEALLWFRDGWLPEAGYGCVVSLDAGYFRGVECALLSRVEITDARVWPGESLEEVERRGPGWAAPPEGAGPLAFRRSPLMADLRTAGGYELTLFVVHHKAGAGFEHQREAEALRTMEKVRARLESDPARNVVVLGDFNAAPWDKSVRVYLEGVIDTLAHRTTARESPESALYVTHESQRVLDYVLLNSAAHRELVIGSPHVCGTLFDEGYDWKSDPYPAGYASDHYPVVVDLVPQDRALRDGMKGDGTSTRRGFLIATAASAAGVLPARAAQAEPPQEDRDAQDLPAQERGQDLPQKPSQEPPREPAEPPPARGVTVSTIMEAEKLAAIEYTRGERELLVQTIAEQIDRVRSRLDWGLPPNDLAPALRFDPRLRPEEFAWAEPAVFAPPVPVDPGPLPERDEDIAFAPLAALGTWLREGGLTSARLTEISLARLRAIGPRLECVVTLTEERARASARGRDRELALGHDRGPLHGIPWGAKDLLDTAGITTTWGAMPYVDRTPGSDAVVVSRLDEAGAVLVAKLTLGALAYGDIWFGGRTRNPWNLEQGSSGSSAGPAAATAAGLVPFALGSETYGSIISPCMRCGATGLRPTFGRVARTGAMSLCWSLDKIGPIARRVEDCMLVLNAITGSDPGDPSSIDAPLAWRAEDGVAGLRLGYDPAWFEGEGAHDLDRVALDVLEAAGCLPVHLALPDWPYGVLENVLLAEAASAFEDLTLSNRDDEMVWQDGEAWPNLFRRTRFLSAIEFVQADRFRRQVMEMMAGVMEGVDALISPSFAGNLLLVTNFTGHPALTVRSGFDDDGAPRGITFWGHLYDEGTLATLGLALERELHVWERRPAL